MPHGAVTLANTRLAIRDPSPAGNQPFESHDRSVVVVFNGEIYNADELAKVNGIVRRSGCDGEVLPDLWRRHGPSCLSLLRGMWAIAVLDRCEEVVWLARDPFGIKPLHWRRVGDAVAFSSEIAPLLRIAPKPVLDPATVSSFLRWGSIPSDRSPWRDVLALAPGECVAIDRGGSVKPVLRAPLLDRPGAPAQSLTEALEVSVLAHVESDVPTTLLLSSGLDSSLLAAAAARQGRSLHCLTVAGGSGRDEAPFAAATAAHYGHSHQSVPATLDGSELDAFFSHMQRPSIDGLNTFLVCGAVHRAGYKVALSGLGGDEALGGYRASRLIPWLPALRFSDRLPAARRLMLAMAGLAGQGPKARRLLVDGPRTVSGLVALERELFDEAVVRRLVGPTEPHDERDAQVEPKSPSLIQLAMAEMEMYLQPTLLPDADAFSMAWSVELRVPFVDRPFLASALTRAKRDGKGELVDDLGDPWLRRLARQPKQGFSVPMLEWMREGPLRDVVSAARSSDAPLWDLVDRSSGTRILSGVDSTERWSEAWALAVLDAWLRRR
jgi:asparagine synthase (glutamine-hydrolysing)